MRMSRSIVRVVTVAVLGAACDAGGGSAQDTFPSGWMGAQTLTVAQSACNDVSPTTMPSFEITDTGGMISGALKDLSFRCQQALCAYVVDSGATTRVLVQPCNLHPTTVPKCGCRYDVTFALPARADRTSVEVYRRDDFYGATTPPVPQLVATKSLVALHWFRTCGDVVCSVGDGGTTSADAGVAACSTEKVGDVCPLADATCDPSEGCNVHLRCADKDPRVQTGGCPISRRAVKRNIAYLDDGARADLAARLRKVRLARYRYEDAPEKERLGFIIDDGQGALAVDQARDQIDLYSYLSWTVAALQAEMSRGDAQAREIAQLRAKIERRERR